MNKKNHIKSLMQSEKDDIIKFAWHDKTSFDKIYDRFGLTESDVVKLMRRELKEGSFIKWRQRTSGRKSKHRELHKQIARFRNQSKRIKHKDVIENTIEKWKDD